MAPRVTPGRGVPRPPDRELLYGRNAVIEALRGRRRPRRLLVTEAAERQPRVAQAIGEATRRGVPVSRVAPDELGQMLGDVNHQGVVLEAGPFPYVDFATLLESSSGRPIVALDHVQDPQNLGALIRTAEATGSAGLLLPERRTAGITPAVVNTSAGAVEHLPVALITNLGRAIETTKAAGYWAVALEAGEGSRNLYQIDVPEPALLVIGSEGRGISPTILDHADLTVSLPMLGRVDSLNAAVAGSIALYELLRRRLTPARSTRQDAGSPGGDESR